ncbi:hypothetical protein CTheo_3226 [Ceratobasidium theobromae]|uniref:PH domain-containing protein n=1 Tax=Ceratobasidium theobromae TaxID=1582974 RepID=A0A5N5QNY1_9AGAM|nr:hypothetical protein CTheo_3226 [Ceratobasidium theobromae]
MITDCFSVAFGERVAVKVQLLATEGNEVLEQPILFIVNAQMPSSPNPTVTTQPSIYSPQPVYHPNIRSPSLHSQAISNYGSSDNSNSSFLGLPLTRDHSAATTRFSADYVPTPIDGEMHVPVLLARDDSTITTYYRRQRFSDPSGKHVQDLQGQTRADNGTKGRLQVALGSGGLSTRTRTDGPTPMRQVLPLGREIGAKCRPRSPVTHRMGQQRHSNQHITPYGSLSRRAPISDLQEASDLRDHPAPTVSVSARREALLPPIPATDGDLNASLDSSQGNKADPLPAPPSHSLSESPTYFSTFARSRGKMRESFTNLIQLLGDKASAKKRNSISPSASRTLNALPKGFKLKLGKQSPSTSPGKMVEKASILPDMNELLKIEPKLVGLLLYQSPHRQERPKEANTTVWMPYNVSLYPTTIVLQAPNPGFSSSNKFQIPLSDLFDAHSVLTKELPPGTIPPRDSPSLPPEFRDEMYVFEVHCYGGRVERFAASSLAARTKWVGYLLDILVGKNPEAQKERASTSSIPPSIAPPVGSVPRPLIAPSARPLSQSSPRASPTALVRPLSTSVTPARPAPPPVTPIRHAAGFGGYLGPPRQLPTLTKAPRRDSDARPTSMASTSRIRPTPLNPRNPVPPVATPKGSSFLMSPRSDRSGMTPSPSISRLDERNLVRNRLAMFERQATSTPSPRGSASLRGKEGLVNWEALSAVRSSRGGSEFMPRDISTGIVGPIPSEPSVVSRRGASPSLGPVLIGFNTRLGSNSSSSSEPRWPFRDSSASMSTDSMSRPSSLVFGLNFPLPGPNVSPPGINDQPIGVPRQGSFGTTMPLVISRPTNRPVEPLPATTPEPIQTPGNLAPSNKAAKSVPDLVETTVPEVSLKLVLEQLTSLAAALRGSDVAHSAKASGLGQLIASTQDHVVHAIGEGSELSSREHGITIERLGQLQESIKLLVDKPRQDPEERAELLVIKKMLERIDKAMLEKLDYLVEERRRAGQAETMVGHIEGLKQTVHALIAKVDNAPAQGDVLVKLGVLAEAITTSASSTRILDPALMEGLVQQIKDHVSSLRAPGLDTSPIDISEIMTRLDSIATETAISSLQVELSDIHKVLEEIRKLSYERRESDANSDPVIAQVDLSDVLVKLDGISTMCESFVEGKPAPQPNGGEVEGLKQEAQDELLAALRQDAEHRTAQAQQTAELVRYSNELNAWLEKFVMNASMQMDGVGAGIGALRRDLGLGPLVLAEEQTYLDPPQSSVLQDLRGMFAEQVKTASEIATSLNALLVAFNEEQTRNAEARQNLATDAVLKMIDVQRQEQERLLKQLAMDLSSDIRGERIRFVEAMSQATSMNVQLHVEEFKKQLTHEVLALTDEVGRLREERKTIQHQIAQLFLVKSEHEVELGISETVGQTTIATALLTQAQLPPRPVQSARPISKQ